MKYRKKPVVIEAMTFGEMVAYGNRNTENIVNDMPWSFEINGQPISHETDHSYVVSSHPNAPLMTLDTMLIIDGPSVVVCDKDIFELTYEKLEEIGQ